MYLIERATNHFLRRENLTYEATRTFHVHDWPEDDRWQAAAIVVTLPAFAGVIKGNDTMLRDAWSRDTMDKLWVAVPVTSDMLTVP